MTENTRDSAMIIGEVASSGVARGLAFVCGCAEDVMGMDGQILWKTRRSPNFNKGSMIPADGLILATDGAKTLYLIEPDPSGFKQLASAEVLAEAGTGSENDPLASRVGGRTQNWAPLALSDGKLLIRDQKQMKCLVVR